VYHGCFKAANKEVMMRIVAVQIGRAGREGQRAVAMVMLRDYDFQLMHSLKHSTGADFSSVQRFLDLLFERLSTLEATSEPSTTKFKPRARGVAAIGLEEQKHRKKAAAATGKTAAPEAKVLEAVENAGVAEEAVVEARGVRTAKTSGEVVLPVRRKARRCTLNARSGTDPDTDISSDKSDVSVASQGEAVFLDSEGEEAGMPPLPLTKRRLQAPRRPRGRTAAPKASSARSGACTQAAAFSSAVQAAGATDGAVPGGQSAVAPDVVAAVAAAQGEGLSKSGDGSTCSASGKRVALPAKRKGALLKQGGAKRMAGALEAEASAAAAGQVSGRVLVCASSALLLALQCLLEGLFCTGKTAACEMALAFK
jgi:hypothetical protein